MADDLTAPVGSRLPWRRRLTVRVPVFGMLSGAAVLIGLGALAYVALVDDPLGGEPVAVVRLDRTAPPAPPAEAEMAMRPGLDSAQEAEALPSGHDMPPADIVIRDATSGAVYAEPGQEIAATITMNPALVEPSQHGLLPRVGPDGQRPAEAYARPVAFQAGDVVRVALIVGGMGLSTTATETAIDRLPGEVTLAFAPYGREIDRLTARARQDGHEIMLQVPLEPYDYPDNDPGPHTLLTGLNDSQNRDRLHWVMSRFSGYVGVTNYMGARFTATDRSLRPFLGELRQRGLIYADDGSSPRSIASQVAREVGLPVASASIVVDAVPTREAIRARLGELVEAARGGGMAVGVATGMPASIETIAEWASDLASEGVVLVPITAVVSGGET